MATDPRAQSIRAKIVTLDKTIACVEAEQYVLNRWGETGGVIVRHPN